MLPNKFFLLSCRIYSDLETFYHVVSPPSVGGSKFTDRYSVPVLMHSFRFPGSADHIFTRYNAGPTTSSANRLRPTPVKDDR